MLGKIKGIVCCNIELTRLLDFQARGLKSQGRPATLSVPIVSESWTEETIVVPG